MPNRANKMTSKSRVNVVIVRAKPGSKTRCLIRFHHHTFQGAWGKNGRTLFKREGDGKTPIANMRVLSGFYKDQRRNRASSKIPMRPLTPKLGWCDEPDHPQYNREVKLPFSKSCETLLRDDELYDFVIILDWNINQRKRGCGSAIFFHIAKPGFKPTEGCIAVRPYVMKRMLPYLTRKSRFKVV